MRRNRHFRNQSSPCGSCREQGKGLCRTCPLNGLKVAVIGGLERMEPAYRLVVQELGAELLFHAGHMRNGGCQLKRVVFGADVVVFITSVNSHSALNVVKSVCKKNGKRFVPLRQTGTESLERALRTHSA